LFVRALSPTQATIAENYGGSCKETAAMNTILTDFNGVLTA